MFGITRKIYLPQHLPESILTFCVTVGIYVVFATPLIISADFSIFLTLIQTFLFRILVEMVFLLYIFLVLLNRSYLPKFSSVLLSVFIFVAILGIATWTGIHPQRSFWGTIIRMEGYILFLHLFLFFLVLVGVFRFKENWIGLIRFILFISLPLALLAISYKAIYPEAVRDDLGGTFGNPSFYGSYLTIIILLSFFWSLWEQNRKYKIFSLLVVFINIGVLLFLNGTRGAWIGTGVAFGFLSLVWFLFFSKAQTQKRKVVLLSICGVLFVFFLLLVLRDSGYFEQNSFWERYGELWQSVLEHKNVRFPVWQLGLALWKESPWLGHGLESLHYLYEKHYRVEFLQYIPQTMSFDRAHNQFIDILISSGILGLFSYGALFASAIGMVIRYCKGRGVSFFAFALIALFLGYAVQNSFVFDTLHSYILFFSLLAFISVIFQPSKNLFNGEQQQPHQWPGHGEQKNTMKTIGAISAFVLMGSVLSAANLRPMAAHIQLRQAEKFLQSAEPQKAFPFIEKAAQGPSVMKFETRLMAAEFLLSSQPLLQDQDFRKEFAQKLRPIIEPIEQHIQEGPDALRVESYTLLTQAYKTLYLIEKDPAHLEHGERILTKAIEFNSQYAEFFFLAGDIKILQRKKEEGSMLFAKGYELEGDLGNFYEHLGRSLTEIEENEEGIKELKKSLALSNFNSIPGREIALRRVLLIANTYKKMGKEQEARAIIEKMLTIFPDARSK